MKVAIVGATGQTGSVIVEALLKSTTTHFVSYSYRFYCDNLADNRILSGRCGPDQTLFPAEAGSGRAEKEGSDNSRGRPEWAQGRSGRGSGRNGRGHLYHLRRQRAG